ncbi:unnamed protein product, partial [marine sediment metagenome]
MKQKGIQEEIKDKVEEIVERFNGKTFRRDDCYYQTRYKGKYLYLDM